MVVKTIPWHYAGFARLTNYLAKERGKEGSIDLEIQHNLRHTRSLAEIVEQFKLNDQHRRERVRGICLYHEIMSFHGDDRSALTPEIIEDLVSTYLELRAPNGLALAMVHQDKEHVHAHIMISGNEFNSPKATRLARADFERVHREIEAYQIEHYGAELQHSIAHAARRQTRKQRREQKEQVKKEVERCLQQSDTLTSFHDHLRAAGLEPYEYRGRSNGVIFEDRKFRFNLLDVDLARIQEMDERKRKREDVEQTRIAELEAIQKSKTDRHLEREQTPEEAQPVDIPEPEAGAAALEMEAEAEALRQEAELDAAHAEAEALHWQAEMEAQGERQAAEIAEQEAARIAELEAIQEEARQRDQSLERE